MGVTIHYNGTMDRARLAEMLDAARLYCAENRWLYHDVDDRILGHVERIVETRETEIEMNGIQGTNVESITKTFPIDDSLRGLIINVHPKCEPVWLTFNEAGELAYYMPLNDLGEYWEMKSLFTKTQFAGTRTHIAVCNFLHYLQDNYFPGLNVYDEANYFESGDASRAAQQIGFLDSIMDRLQSALEDETIEDEAADMIRGALDSAESDTENAEPKPGRKKIKVERGKAIAHRDPQWKRGHGKSAGKN